jgi:glycogen operon protein
MRHEGVPIEHRGTFAGMSHPKVVEYLKALGITSVELLPIQAIVDERFLTRKGLRNYWGYNTIGYFAPEPSYLCNNSLAEFKSMVQTLHEGGIEVLLDVVYNHTAEGDHLGPTLSFRGIDNLSYYRLQPDRRYYINVTGCGNTLNLSHPRVLQMVMDSLRYWVIEMHVDGFRFDLAATLGREEQGFDQGSGFFDAIRQDPVIAKVKLIAEPWDVGPGGHQLGSFPPGSGEWNDRFRDAVRRCWRGERGTLPDLATNLLGSSDIFQHHGRRPRTTINYVASHDGFTLADLVSYEERHNHANGENNQDGHPHNFSANYGVEGATNDPQIRTTRMRVRRGILATIFLAQGTPMLLAGDEVGRSQGGNNNAYCQDNEVNWIQWTNISAEEWQLRDYVSYLIKLRRDHPVLRRSRFLHGLNLSSTTNLRDVEWMDPNGNIMSPERWREVPCLGLLLAGDAGFYMMPDGSPETDDTLLLIFNPHHEVVSFTLPSVPHAEGWRCLLDSTSPTGKPENEGVMKAMAAYNVPARSVTLFALVPAGGNSAEQTLFSGI